MIQRLFSFAFPAQCAACRRPGRGLCERCAPVEAPLARDLPTLRVTALANYTGAFKKAIHALKDGRRDVAYELGTRLAPLATGDLLFVPVPTPPSRRRTRGIDGVEYLANVAAHESGASVILALRCTGRVAQRGRTRVERLSARGRFECTSGLVRGTQIVLVDDVCTTGATLEDCAEALRREGARVSQAFVVAVANGTA